MSKHEPVVGVAELGDASKEGYSSVGVDEIPASRDGSARPTHQGRQWRTGHKERFPKLSFWCLLGVIGLCVAVVVILLISNQKDVDSWCSGRMKVMGHERAWQITVSVWISLLTFLAGQLLAVVFAEAIAVSWWVDAMKGQTLHRLHHNWEAGTSVARAISTPRLFSWVCVGSIAHAAFSGLGTVLQKASSTTTVLSTYPADMTSNLAGALPAGFSGVFSSPGHDTYAVTYLTERFLDIISDYTTKAPIELDVGGCSPTSNVSCVTTVVGVGFDYQCSAGRSNLSQWLDSVDNSAVEPVQTVFKVGFDWDYSTPWHIDLTALWKDSPQPRHEVITSRKCRLVPALVEYPVNISCGVATLQGPKSDVSWNVAPSKSERTQPQVDKVIRHLPRPALESNDTQLEEPGSGTRSTLGGLWVAFDSLFSAEITASFDVTNMAGADVRVQGAFAAPFAVFPSGTTDDAMANSTYASPMAQLVANIREIMFRTSVAVVQHNITDMAWGTDDSSGFPSPIQIHTTHCPNLTATRPGKYNIYHTVYHTGYIALGLAIGLMCLVVACILPLFWGYWRLGRKVSLSPFEMAKALHQPADIDINGARQHISVLDLNVHNLGQERLVGSNYRSEELVDLLGDMKVRYGEVEPGVVGLGPVEHTVVPKRGSVYH